MSAKALRYTEVSCRLAAARPSHSHIIMAACSTATMLRLCPVQLADFGLTRVLDVDKKTHVSTQTYGTVAYMPPELLSASRLTKSVSGHADAIGIHWGHAASLACMAVLGLRQRCQKKCLPPRRGALERLLHAQSCA